MKLTAFLCILTSLLLGISCSKKSSNNDPAYVGKWRYLYSVGGFSGRDTITAGNDQLVLELQSNNKSTVYKNGTVAKQSDYFYVKTDSIPPTINFLSTIIIDNKLFLWDIQELVKADATLVLRDRMITDGYTAYFIRSNW